MGFKQFLKPSSENLTASGKSAFRSPKRLSNFYYWVKPDWRKIVIFVILLIFVTIIIPITTARFGIYTVSIGFPLVFYEETFLPREMEKTNFLNLLKLKKPVFVTLNFVIDIIVLYLLSCLIIWIYDKVKKKS